MTPPILRAVRVLSLFGAVDHQEQLEKQIQHESTDVQAHLQTNAREGVYEVVGIRKQERQNRKRHK